MYLESINLLKGWSKCWRYERAFMTQFVLNEGAFLHKELDMAVASQRFEEPNLMHQILFNGFVPQGWYFQNQIHLDRFFLSLIQTMDVDNHRIHPDQAQKGLEKLTQESPYRRVFANIFPGTTVPINLKRAARTQSALDMAILSCALERHRLAKGSYPENLALLSSDIFPKVTNDLITGQPLCYRRIESAYLLYSPGWNQKDDGGQVHEKLEEGDWVWSKIP